MNQQDSNLATVQAFNAALNRHDLAAALGLVASDATIHGSPAGRDSYGRLQEDVTARFPDRRFDIAELLAVDDQVIARITYSGTHLGVGRLPVDGGQMIGVAPTGRRFAVQHLYWFTLTQGRIADQRATRDDISMLMQLGLLPDVRMVSKPAAIPEAVQIGPNVSGTEEQARNIEATQRWFEAFANGDVDTVVAGCAPDASNHGRPVGPDGFRMIIEESQRLYTRVSEGAGVKAMVAVDDSVVARFNGTLRHTGVSQIPIDGGLLMGKPATGRTYELDHIHWLKFADGLITQHHACRDDVGMMVQLGLLPAPEPLVELTAEAQT